jgi:hypothetical protein
MNRVHVSLTQEPVTGTSAFLNASCKVRRVFGGAVAVGNDDDEGVRSGDRCSEAGAVGDIRMLGNRLVDGAEGGGGGGGSIHRGWAAELQD